MNETDGVDTRHSSVTIPADELMAWLKAKGYVANPNQWVNRIQFAGPGRPQMIELLLFELEPA